MKRLRCEDPGEVGQAAHLQPGRVDAGQLGPRRNHEQHEQVTGLNDQMQKIVSVAVESHAVSISMRVVLYTVFQFMTFEFQDVLKKKIAGYFGKYLKSLRQYITI